MLRNRESKFVAAFHKLPRELRDQIYRYLFEDTAGKHFMGELHAQTLKAELPGCVNLCVVNFPLPPYADAEIIGPSIANEALEYAYSKLFRKCYIHPYNLKSFLQPKLPGVDVSVAYYVRKLDIEWENREAGTGLLSSRDIPEEKLQTLELLHHGEGVVVENLIRCAMMEGVDEVGSFLEKFRSIYDRLKSCAIDMRFRGEERLEPFKYFTSPDEWKHQYEEIRKKVR